jgi:Acylphosphatase
MSADMIAPVIRHVVIRGRVQGVGYRAFTEYAALDHRLAGWVRNRRDGGVEAVFAGPAEAMPSSSARRRRTSWRCAAGHGSWSCPRCDTSDRWH